MIFSRVIVATLSLAVATPSSAFVSTSAKFSVNQRTSSSIFSTTENEEAAQKKTGGEKPPSGHAVPAGAMKELSPEETKIQAALAEHQQNAPKLGFASDVRTLVEYNHGFAVISTNSKAMEGFPNGSVVAFSPDEDGNPIFLFSGMSSHTQDLLNDPRCSLTVASKQFKGAADGRVNLMGTTTRLPGEEKEAAKTLYLKKHPGAFWIDFGDFHLYKMEIEKINFVGGFARAGSITPEEYKEAKPDLISSFGSHVADHMNDDHMDATMAMVESQVPGLSPSEAIITSVDSLGMYVKVTRSDDKDQSQTFKMRLPFPRQAENRKDVKDLIVEMTRTANPAPAEG